MVKMGGGKGEYQRHFDNLGNEKGESWSASCSLGEASKPLTLACLLSVGANNAIVSFSPMGGAIK